MSLARLRNEGDSTIGPFPVRHLETRSLTHVTMEIFQTEELRGPSGANKCQCTRYTGYGWLAPCQRPGNVFVPHYETAYAVHKVKKSSLSADRDEDHG